MISRALVYLVFTLSFLSAPLFASERITRFHSDIEIRSDRSLKVTETIDVVAEHIAIRRGIYRDFPTVYPHPGWGDLVVREKTGFEPVSVKVDGQDSPWHLEALPNGIRLYIGDPNQYVTRGPHQYEIRYRSTRQIARIGDNDVLQWNVNGQGWVFPSDIVSATVYFPGHTRALDYAAWTGRAGSRETHYQSIENSDGSITFTSTRPFKSYEGMTISLGLPADTVAAREGQFMRLVQDNFKWFTGLLLLLILPFYYIKAWLAVGRDPQKGVVFADYHPVRDLSPAAHRFVTLNKTDDIAFTAALINIAIKGFARIEQMGSKAFILHNTPDDERHTRATPLTDNEKVVHSTLFQGADQITLGEDYNATVARAKQSLGKRLKEEWRNAIYRNNQRYSWIGLLVGVAALVLCGQHLNNTGFEFDNLIPLAVFVFLSIGLTQRKFHALALLPAVFMLASGLLEKTVSMIGSTAMIWLSLFVAALFLLFHYLLKAPTPFGQKILDEIEGFRLYLATAEQHRLNILHPPDRTPELFERLLPYAIALGVENQWSEQFSGILNRGTRDKDTYQPDWYIGSNRHGFKASSLGSTLGAGLAGSVASAATAPSSSSGGFSGGGAGGGGGGGGGGGW